MASIQHLKASDGSGNASTATVQSTRSALASTIVVDTVAGINPDGFSATMGTPHVFVDPVTAETIVVISETTAVDFTGHVDGSNLEIDDIAPGYTDNGSVIGDIVIIRPTTQWSDNVADVLEVAHADNGTLKPAIIYDSNGNEEIKFTATTSAVNEFTVANAATGNGAALSATGGDTNIDINLTPKGTGKLKVGGNPIDHGAWASWTPTWQNLTVGNGTVVAKYSQVGKTINLRLVFTMGSTSAMGTNPTFSLPVPPVSYGFSASGGPRIGIINVEDNAVTNFMGGVQLTSSTTGLFVMWRADSTFVASSSISSTSPMTWGTNDEITAMATYEAA